MNEVQRAEAFGQVLRNRPRAALADVARPEGEAQTAEPLGKSLRHGTCTWERNDPKSRLSIRLFFWQELPSFFVSTDISLKHFGKFTSPPVHIWNFLRNADKIL